MNVDRRFLAAHSLSRAVTRQERGRNCWWEELFSFHTGACEKRFEKKVNTPTDVVFFYPVPCFILENGLKTNENIHILLPLEHLSLKL